MKEQHLFYAPEAATTHALSADDAAHALRVLRVKAGDALWVTDGVGNFYEGMALPGGTGKHPECYFELTHRETWKRPWLSNIHLAVAPTKNIDRIEWMVEKATEIGVDAFHLLCCANSERRVVKTERLEKIIISAMKQSHKAWKPTIGELTDFKKFIAQPFDGDKFIAHCYAQEDISGGEKAFLFDVVRSEVPTLVLIGPEGDFSIDEVKAAEAAGFRPITLGDSRLRTETAALTAVTYTHLRKTWITATMREA